MLSAESLKKIEFLPCEKLQALAVENAQAYQTAKPFPHGVFDNFFDPAMLDQVLAEFPSADAIDWKKFNNAMEVKLASRHEKDLGIITQHFIHALNSATFLDFLSTLTGIEHLIPDPYLEGGGLHQIRPGGKLGIHADFNKHKKYKLDRRINVLVYLNKEWQENYGGHLELWDTRMTHCEKKILPIFNRLAIFSTTDFTFHGHPEPLQCPEDRTRKSIALYYYTNGRPKEEIGAKHNTLFKTRPGEKALPSKRSLWVRLKRRLNLF